MSYDSPRVINLCGDVEEEGTKDIIEKIITLDYYGASVTVIEKKGKPVETVVYEPIHFFISTHGGSAREMFSMYDLMRAIYCPVYTFGIGKVMSAGVLLLAAGNKGNRMMGKNCRIMIHNLLGGTSGPIYSVQNETEEMEWIQDNWKRCMVEETKFTKRSLDKLLNKRENIYLSADEALKYGIVDKII